MKNKRNLIEDSESNFAFPKWCSEDIKGWLDAVGIHPTPANIKTAREKIYEMRKGFIIQAMHEIMEDTINMWKDEGIFPDTQPEEEYFQTSNGKHYTFLRSQDELLRHLGTDEYVSISISQFNKIGEILQSDVRMEEVTLKLNGWNTRLHESTKVNVSFEREEVKEVLIRFKFY